MSMLGMVMAFVGSEDKIPLGDGWLPCDGRALPRTGQYADLFGIIGTLHGVGDGVNTFNIPDLRGYFLRGVTGTSQVDKGLGERTPVAGDRPNEAGSLQHAATALPRARFQTAPVGDHTHGDPTWNGGAGPYELATTDRGPGGYDYGAQSAPTTAAGGHSHEIVAGGDVETRPANKYVHWLIMARLPPTGPTGPSGPAGSSGPTGPSGPQ